MIRTPQGAAIWWRNLTPDPARQHAGDRGALARLRRCAAVAEAMQEPATFELFQRCGAEKPHDLPTVGLAAAVLAHVREDRTELRVARQVGPESPEKPETALLKPLRFRRLLEAATEDECLVAFRRLVALAGGSVNLRDLSQSLFDWPDPRRSVETRRRWIFDYWNADPAHAPSAPAAPAEEPAR